MAIEDEGRDFVKYLSNKAKLVMLSVSDVASGKMEQGLLTNKNQGESVQIEEIHNGGNEDTTGTDGDHSSAAWGFRNFLGGGGAAEPEEEPEAEVLPVPEGEEDMPVADEAIPCDTTGQTACDDLGGEEGEREDVYDCEAAEE